MENLLLLVDYRERKVFDALSFNADIKSGAIKYNIQNLNYGDYNIMFNSNVIAVFERKTWKDLAATIKDKQRSENIEKLHFCRNETNCDIYYIIEGAFRFADEKKIGGIPFNNLQMKLLSLMINDKIHVVQSANEQHTIDLIIKFAKYYLKKNKLGSAELPPPPEETPQTIDRRIWNNLKGLGKVSTEIVSHHYTIGDYIDGRVNREDLEKIKINKRAINLFLKNSINENGIRILSGILRVSETIAVAILTDRTITDVKKMDPMVLAEVQITIKNNSRRVGKALAERIITILNYKAP